MNGYLLLFTEKNLWLALIICKMNLFNEASCSRISCNRQERKKVKAAVFRVDVNSSTWKLNEAFTASAANQSVACDAQSPAVRCCISECASLFVPLVCVWGRGRDVQEEKKSYIIFQWSWYKNFCLLMYTWHSPVCYRACFSDARDYGERERV